MFYHFRGPLYSVGASDGDSEYTHYCTNGGDTGKRFFVVEPEKYNLHKIEFNLDQLNGKNVSVTIDSEGHDFGLCNSPCYFCGYQVTLSFNEHYTFCPDCTAIYTECVVEKGCSHIVDHGVFVTKYPWYKSVREKAGPSVTPENTCSECNSEIFDGGW